MNIFALLGKLLPWAVGAIAGLLTLLGALPDWWPTIASIIVGISQLLISTGPKTPA